MPENSFAPTKDEPATVARQTAAPGQEAGLTVLAKSAAHAPDRVLDITAETCPMTFVRTRLALDRLAPGQTLLVLLRGDEPRARVPATIRSLGHEILAQDDALDGVTRLLIRHA